MTRIAKPRINKVRQPSPLASRVDSMDLDPSTDLTPSQTSTSGQVVFDHGAGKQIVHRCLAEHGDLAGSISILLGEFRAASNRESAELLQVNVQC
jgi:hypothetical protein